MDLKGLLGEELHKQVTEKLGDTKVDIIKDRYVPISRFNEANEAAKQEKEALQKQLDETAKTLDTIKGEAGASDELKQRIEALETEKKKIEEEGKAALDKVKFDTALEKELAAQGAKNVVAVRALIDTGVVQHSDAGFTGLKEQLDKLKESESTSFMFGETKIIGKQTPKKEDSPDPTQQKAKDPMDRLKQLLSTDQN